jgi:hypothetical protein
MGSLCFQSPHWCIYVQRWPCGAVEGGSSSFLQEPLQFFNENIGEWAGAGSKASDSVGGSDALYTLDGDTGWTGVLRIDRSRILHSSRRLRVSCEAQSVSIGNR